MRSPSVAWTSTIPLISRLRPPVPSVKPNGSSECTRSARPMRAQSSDATKPSTIAVRSSTWESTTGSPLRSSSSATSSREGARGSREVQLLEQGVHERAAHEAGQLVLGRDLVQLGLALGLGSAVGLELLARGRPSARSR